jgi:DNA-binding beta-propeller fold protein YncE
MTPYAPGKDPIQFRTPTHIAFGPGEQEIITDLKNHRLVYRTDPKKPFQASPIPLKGPHSVVYNPADKLYYVNDTDNHRIIAFAELSSKVIVAETKTIAGVKLQRPHDVVLDPATGWIYAINPNSGHVFRFTAIGENESALSVPVQGYARALTFANGKLYAIGSAKGRIVEIVDWDTKKFAIHDSHDPSGGRGPAGSWTKTGLVLNDAEFFDGFWYATSYFTRSYAKGTDFDTNKFIRFKTFDDLKTGKWTDLSSLVPSGMTPYYLTAKRDKLYLAIFNHEKPGKGDAILQYSPPKP